MIFGSKQKNEVKDQVHFGSTTTMEEAAGNAVEQIEDGCDWTTSVRKQHGEKQL